MSPTVAVLERMSLSELCAHFTTVEHMRVRRDLTRLVDTAREFDAGARAATTWISDLRARIAAMRNQIIAHLRTESKSLFPMLRQLESAGADSTVARDVLAKLITHMRGQHNDVEEALDALAVSLGDHRSAHPISPAGHALLAAVRRLENRIHEQIYRENQVLFRRAAGLALASFPG